MMCCNFIYFFFYNHTDTRDTFIRIYNTHIYIYDVYCIGHRQYQRYLNILFWGCLSGAVGSVDVWCSARQSCRGRGFESR